MTGENAAPAEMPGVEERVEALARLIAPEAFKAFDDDYRPGQSAPSSAQMRTIGPMNKARAAARAFFAPILAEKERLAQVSALMCDDCGWAMRFPDLGCVHCGFHRAEARALAAEAALAAERERCLKVAVAEVERSAAILRPSELAVTVAAAIRAQGE